MQIPKGEIITLKVYQKSKTKHQSKALSLAIASNAENSDDELYEEDEEKLTFLTKRVQQLLRSRKRAKKEFLQKKLPIRRKF